MVVYQHTEGSAIYNESIFIERDEDSNMIRVYGVELFTRVSDSWIDEDGLKSINESCDSNYEFDKEMDRDESIQFTSDLCWYYGAINFDSYPIEFKSYKKFCTWLKMIGIN